MRAPRGAQEVVKSRPPHEQRQRAAAVHAAMRPCCSRASPPSSPRIQRANPMGWLPKSRQRCTHTADVSSAHRVHILRRTMSSHAAVGVAHSTGHWHDRHKLSRPRGAALGSFGKPDAIILLRLIASEALAIDFGASPKEFHPQWRRPLQHNRGWRSQRTIGRVDADAGILWRNILRPVAVARGLMLFSVSSFRSARATRRN